MENLLKAAILFLLTLIVLQLLTRRSKTRERSKKTEYREAEGPPVSIHGYISPDAFPSGVDGCDAPSSHHGALIKAAGIFRADITTEVSDSVCGSCRKIAIPHIAPS